MWNRGGPYEAAPDDGMCPAKGSTIHGIARAVTPAVWCGEKRWIDFQDGAMLPAAKAGSGGVMPATYPNNEIAVASYRYGKGRVGLAGSHPRSR
ncbi:hypothetical protein [Burkholderia pyrrocinia]|uniref:hypothetical protein n=1 Tax=Burkholderia pyrrocinia TaxID=60550 RepID=UPI0030D2ED7B